MTRFKESRLLRFAAVGTAGFLVNEAALWLALNLLRVNAYTGGVLCFLVAATFTWWGNRVLTFSVQAARRAHTIAAEWLTFLAVSVVGFAVNYAVYALLIARASSPLNNPFLALAFGTLAGLLFNFALSSAVVFRAPKAC